MRPLLYDVYCGAGGAARGYQQAGFRVVGIDHEPQPHWCGDGFMQMDAFEFFRRYQVGEYETAAAFHASPPCQGYSRMRHLPWLKDKVYPLLIDPTRAALEATELPWIIENVEDAPLRNGVTLCGAALGLKVYRHRKFESSVMLMAPAHQKHPAVIGHGRMLNDRAEPNADGWVSLPSKGRGMRIWQDNGAMADGHGSWKKSAASAALGIDWMTRHELSQSIPPAFTLFVGAQLMQHLGAEVAS